MTPTGADQDPAAAQAMLEAFASVGASRFDLSIISRSGEKVLFRPGVKLGDLRRALPSILSSAATNQTNVIVRPHGNGVAFIQLDDLKRDPLAQLAPAVFLILNTSPGNYQAWAALDGPEDKDFARRLRKGTGADMTASGATRVAGSLNFKDKYAPNFPRVQIEQTQLRRKATAAELEQLGLVAARDSVPAMRPLSPPARPRLKGQPSAWPDYERILRGAKLNHDQTRPDISAVDFLWCKIASQFGWGVDEIAARLMEISAKAQENGKRYAVRTARAGDAAALRDGPPIRTPDNAPQHRPRAGAKVEYELLLKAPETKVDEDGRFETSLCNQDFEPLRFDTKKAAAEEMAAYVELIKATASLDPEGAFRRGRYTIAVVRASDPNKFKVFEAGGPDVLTFDAPARPNMFPRRSTVHRPRR